jgi:pilus assembly protein CpaE
MYPYPVVLVGSSEGLPELDSSLLNCAAKIEGHYPDLRAVRSGRPSEAEPAVFLFRLREVGDLPHLKLLSDSYPGHPIIGLVEGGADEAALYRMNRAGATQLVPVPWEPGDLSAALDRVARQFGRVPPLARVITVCGVVGGAGATTLALNLGSELAIRWGKRCVLAEPTTVFGQLAAYLNVASPRSTQELYHGSATPTSASVQQALTPITEQVSLLSAPSPTFPVRPLSATRVDMVIEACRPLADVVIVDLPYTFDDACIRLLTRSDEVLLVSNLSLPALQTLRIVKDAITQLRGAGPVRVVIDKFVKREGLEPARLCTALGVEHVLTVAEDQRAFLAVEDAGVPLPVDAPSSPSVTDLELLGTSLFGPPVVPAPPRSAFPRWNKK